MKYYVDLNIRIILINYILKKMLQILRKHVIFHLIFLINIIIIYLMLVIYLILLIIFLYIFLIILYLILFQFLLHLLLFQLTMLKKEFFIIHFLFIKLQVMVFVIQVKLKEYQLIIYVQIIYELDLTYLLNFIPLEFQSLKLNILNLINLILNLDLHLQMEFIINQFLLTLFFIILIN